MNNSQVAHAWAAQSKESGKGSNLFFSGTKIYSYGHHYLAARFTEARCNGARVVLVNSRGYSNTTQRHLSLIRGALRGLNVKTFDVPDLGEPLNHDANLAHFRAEYDAAVRNASTSRKYASLHLERAESFATTAYEYCSAFTLTHDAFPAIDDATLLRAREAAKAESKEATARKKSRAAEQAKTMAERVAAWLAGDSVSLYSHNGETLLRVKGDVIQTSRGAEVPVSVAPKLWRAIQHVKAGNPFTLVGLRVGLFELRNIATNGDVVIGCHSIGYAELSRIALELGL